MFSTPQRKKACKPCKCIEYTKLFDPLNGVSAKLVISILLLLCSENIWLVRLCRFACACGQHGYVLQPYAWFCTIRREKSYNQPSCYIQFMPQSAMIYEHMDLTAEQLLL